MIDRIVIMLTCFYAFLSMICAKLRSTGAILARYRGERGNMLEHLPEEVRAGLAAAQDRADRKARSRLRVQAGETVYPILRSWSGGFSVAADRTPHLRGLVDIHDGARHLYQALIVASRLENRELVFEYKRSTSVSDTAPADFERTAPPPAALLTRY